MTAWVNVGEEGFLVPIRIQPGQGALAFAVVHSKGAPDEREEIELVEAFHAWAVRMNIPHETSARQFGGKERIERVLLCFNDPHHTCSFCRATAVMPS